MSDNINFDYKNLTPFKWFVLENFPFIEADFDALTDWQLFCKLGKEMNKIINSENTLGSQMENVTNAFIDLQNYVNNYFDNLDLQEEVNNKVDELVENGTFDEIISRYIYDYFERNFNTVNEMKSSNLSNNMRAKTLGYHDYNDGGGASYYITDTQPENEYYETLDNGNYAVLIIEKEIDPLQFGCYGNGINDDTLNLQKCINYGIDNNISIKTRGDKTFLISSSLNINNKVEINFNGATVKTNNAIDMFVYNYLTGNDYQGYLKNVVIDMNNIATTGIKGIRIIKVLLSSIVIKNISNIGYQIDNGNEVIFENSHFYGNGGSSIGLMLNKGDCHYKDLIMIDVNNAIYSKSSNFFSRIHAWIKTPSFVHNSVFFKSDTTNESFLNQCYSDTYYIGFKIERFHRLKLNEHYNHYNSTILNSTVLENIGGKVYFLHYSDKQYSQFTCIENSKIEGLNYSPTNSLLSNLNEYEKRVFIDSQTTLTDLNSKEKAIFYNGFTIESPDIELSNNKENVIKTQNNVSDLNLYINIINQINANTNTKILSFNSQYAPLSEKVFIAPFGFQQGYKISGYVFCTLTKTGQLFINSSDNLPVNSRIYISKSYLNSIQS